MRPGDTIELDIENMSFGPAAVGRIQTPDNPRPLVVFVRGAAPGERVRAKLTKSQKSYWEAELVEVLKPSSDRQTPPCPVFGKCGGCQWQHLNYPAQVRAKEQILIHQLNRATRLGESQLHSLLTTHSAPNPLHYRARLQIHGDERGIGFFAAGSHDIAYTDHCPVARPEIQAEWTKLLSKKEVIKELSSRTGQFKVEWTLTEAGQVREAINRKHAALGFTQVNPDQNEALVGLVQKLSGSGGTVFDLYGGDGNLSHRLLAQFKHVISVDSFNDGEDPAGERASLPEGRLFIKERTEDFLVNQRWRDWNLSKLDCVVADPPRDGLKDAAKRIAALGAPRVVLVSCDPSTLARDLTSFTSEGSYRIEQIHLIDMFPQTFHMETVVLLTK